MARARALSARHLTDKAWSSKPPYFSEQFVFLGQLLLLRLSKKQQPKKYKAAFLSRDKPHCGGRTAAVVGLLLAAFYDPVWTAEILTKLDYALAAAALSAM